MYKKFGQLAIFTLLSSLILACSEEVPEIPTWQIARDANLLLEVELNPAFYRLSNFGEPPQMAIWLESMDSSQVKTLWVSSRMAKGVWVGKVVCPTALPYWISRRDIESGGGIPSFLKPLPDGITGATPKNELKVYTSVPVGSAWRYFLELNVSGDYNETYLASQFNGSPDPDGNGQPSLIYSGILRAEPGYIDTARIQGRTEQMMASSEIIDDLSGFTTAHQVLKSFTATSIQTQGATHE